MMHHLFGGELRTTIVVDFFMV